jgi:primosomal protein N' (replication factor Y) (superfamily II helicase)
MSDSPFWKVIVPVPLRREFIYEIPPEIGTPTVGARVLVPFGRRRVTGYLLSQVADVSNEPFQIKKAQKLLDDTPAVTGELLRMLSEAAGYYLHPKGEVVRSALPPGIDITERQGTLKEPRVGPKSVTWVRPLNRADLVVAAADALQKRASRQSALLTALAEGGEMLLADLRKMTPNATQLVKRFAARGLVALEERLAVSDPFENLPIAPDSPPTLTDEQAVAVSRVVDRVNRGGYEGFLLHGVTGSGKTEVYLRIIDQVRAKGRGALVLVPEIALTPQLVHRYRARFGDGLAVWHSGLSDQARYLQWRALRDGGVQVAIGVRSAVFAPVRDLGIIIVDEEHDSSFKQETGFRYHARDLALLRAARNSAIAVLGSATPSLETLGNVTAGKLTRLILTMRATAQSLPRIEIVDMTAQRSGPGNQEIISKPLFDAVTETLARKEQTILFLNRRGFAPTMLCKGCGAVIRCDDCAVSMTYHKRPPRLVCHYCGAGRPVPERCNSCGGTLLDPVGVGTQKVEEVLTALFPSARIARLDRDTGAGAKAEQVLERLRNREIDILAGTQMVTKGHDFPDVTLVGVLNADVGLQMPDLRAAERTFQLLTQVAGRAGRSARKGRALIQTRNPDHPAIRLAREHDFNGFSELEMQARKELGYPPFGRLTLIRLSAREEMTVEAEARSLFAALRQQQSAMGARRAVSLLGPAPAPMSFVQGRYRYRILLKAARQDEIRALIMPLIDRIEAPRKGVRIAIDIDPYTML